MKRILFFALFVAMVFFPSYPMTAQESEDNTPDSIQLDPVADINPVKTQHTIVATVLSKSGKPLKNQRVEWILARAPKAVGDIVEHDDMNAIVGTQKIVKLGNHYTVTYTNENAVVLDMGTPDVRDDVKVGEGQTWITITSPVEGETHIIAFCPAIKNKDQHKAFAIKHWVDAKISWPEDATNKVGVPHTFRFKIIKASTNTPLVGYRLKWELAQGETDVPAYLGTDYAKKIEENETNQDGEATVTLNQIKMVEGTNRIKIELKKPTGEVVGLRTVTKTWIAPKIVVQKTGPDKGILGEKIVYTIELSNPGAAEANEVILQDTLPEGISYLECSVPPDDIQGKVLRWKIGILPKDAVKKFVLTCKAEQVGKWTNTAEVTCKEYAPQRSQWDVEVGAPELYLIKDGIAEVRKDNLVNYSVTIKNNGNAVAKQVYIRDEIPAGMKFRNNADGFVMKWNVGDLKPGESRTFPYTLEAIKTGVFINTVKAYMGKEKEVYKTDFKTKVVAPDLKLSKTVEGSPRVILTRPVEYTITIANDGDASAKDVVVVDTLPKELDYVSSEPRGIFKEAKDNELATITWKFGEILPGKNIVIKLTTRSNAVSGRCRNSVKLRSDSPELPKIPPLEAYCDISIQGIPAMHINSYDTEDPVEIGKQTIYVIEVRNEGTSPCTNIIMENHIDDEMEYISASGPTSHRVEGTKVIFEAVAILQPGDKLTYKIVCKAVKEGSAKNTATLRYDQFNKPIIDEEGTTVYK